MTQLFLLCDLSLLNIGVISLRDHLTDGLLGFPFKHLRLCLPVHAALYEFNCIVGEIKNTANHFLLPYSYSLYKPNCRTLAEYDGDLEKAILRALLPQSPLYTVCPWLPWPAPPPRGQGEQGGWGSHGSRPMKRHQEGKDWRGENRAWGGGRHFVHSIKTVTNLYHYLIIAHLTTAFMNEFNSHFKICSSKVGCFGKYCNVTSFQG